MKSAAPAARDSPHPPYRWAIVAAVVVFAGYLPSLAPTVTFWDAGELIAAARILGIPHPPGTPLFVLVGHVWGSLLPFGEYAFRLNLLSAILSAAGAGCLFLVAHDTLRRYAADLTGGQDLVAIGGALAGSVVAAFTFTQWQNSNEAEVYAAATLIIALTCWLCLVWRSQRGTMRAQYTLLLILYLAGLSIGNHLLALLAGPAVVAFLASTLRQHPDSQAREGREEWAQVAVVAGLWALLVGIGLGSMSLLAVGALCFVGAAVFAASAGSLPFALIGLAVASIGVTSYFYLYIRAGLHPHINEAAPETWDALLQVIRRAQYPARTPLDDPTVFHGPDNPGRTAGILWLQLLNYLQYFNAQWANGIRGVWASPVGWFPWRTVVTVLFGGLGLRGMRLQRATDRSSWLLCMTLFLVTGLGLVLYMNFKPGYSIGYDKFLRGADHEVRERDYFFVVSFLVWGVWAGMGLAALARSCLTKLGGAWRLAGAGVLGLAVVPYVLNFPAASRRHAADGRLAADFAYNLLNSVPPYGILFTYGDNDTFPLWWAQEVAEVRRDVSVVCLALAQSGWYDRQLRDNPVRPFDVAAAPAIWRERQAAPPTWPLHSMTDTEIAEAVPTQLPKAFSIPLGAITFTLPARTILFPGDIVALRIIQENMGRRPIAWALTAGSEIKGLAPYVLQQGLVFSLQPGAVDTNSPSVDRRRMFDQLLDVPITDRLMWDTYRYGGLERGAQAILDPTSRGIASELAMPFAQLGSAYEERGDSAQAAKNYRRAAALTPDPAFGRSLESRARGLAGQDQETGRVAK